MGRWVVGWVGKNLGEEMCGWVIGKLKRLIADR